eukprot:CAMPEP_0172453070 /NCGR_PEP_ID=MMETSP1065-20121228/10542_1 /TAXON_ID=265537 /ORGANISM="Amphiprora paludosa, Strain CCMP125" /LENGTH=651 /DNA_ID=CAMNT_0013205233 /DNA_START=196 /DNA_END=2151 /DNA_ORIENTATION=-
MMMPSSIRLDLTSLGKDSSEGRSIRKIKETAVGEDEILEEDNCEDAISSELVQSIVKHMQHASLFYHDTQPHAVPSFENAGKFSLVLWRDYKSPDYTNHHHALRFTSFRLLHFCSGNLTDIEIGIFLGKGEFGTVYAVDGFRVASTTNAKEHHAAVLVEENEGSQMGTQLEENCVSPLEEKHDIESAAEGNIHSTRKTETLQSDSATSFEDSADDLKIFMIKNPMRFCINSIGEKEVGDNPRYAIKCLNKNLQSSVMPHFGHRSIEETNQQCEQIQEKKMHVRKRAFAIIDLAREAAILERIRHPNIVRLRGVVGKLGTPSYCLLLDRLTQTLTTKIQNEWKPLNDQLMSSLEKNDRKWKWKTRLFSNDSVKKNMLDFTCLFEDRLLALYDVARALRHLHSVHLIYRDLKPDNIGFDNSGGRLAMETVRLFDFGLCRELKPNDLVQRPDSYLATGMAGTPRYMAPEVIQEQPYGFSADVYSFGILIWQVLALERPFDDCATVQEYMQRVLNKTDKGADAENAVSDRHKWHRWQRKTCAKGSSDCPMLPLTTAMFYNPTSSGAERGLRQILRRKKNIPPPALQQLLEQCWSMNPIDRPSMATVCQVLRDQLVHSSSDQQQYPKNGMMDTSNRSHYLLELSKHAREDLMLYQE